MKRAWTAIGAGAVVVAMALVVWLAPTGYVLRAPGPAVDLLAGTSPLLVSSAGTTVPGADVLATSMDQTGQAERVSLPRVIDAYLQPNHDALPRDAVYPPGQDAAGAAAAHEQVVATSREAALVAGARLAGITVLERVRVAGVWQKGPAYQVLYVGDYILQIDETPMQAAADVPAYIQSSHKPGDQVVVTVLRGDLSQKVTIKLVGSSADGTVPTLGVTCDMGYWYTPRVDVMMSVDRGDPAQGLALALATYVLLYPGATTPGVVAAVGVVAPDGTVSDVAGITEHAASAWAAHATTLLIPAGNCAGLARTYPGMTIVPVHSVSEAVNVLSVTGAPLPHC